MRLRPYVTSDTKTLMQLFHTTVHSVNVMDYTAEQIDAWAPPNQDPALWRMRLSAGQTLVAEDKNGKIIGFGSLSDMDFLDMLFVHTDYIRRGIGSLLLEALCQYARKEGHRQLRTMASLTALPFFKAHDFHLVAPHSVKRRGTTQENYELTKTL